MKTTIKKSKGIFLYVFLAIFIIYLLVGAYMTLWDFINGFGGVFYRLSMRDITIPLDLVVSPSYFETLFIGFGFRSVSVVSAAFLCCIEKMKFNTVKSMLILVPMVIIHLMSLFLYTSIYTKDFDCLFHVVLTVTGFALFFVFVVYQIKLLLKIINEKKINLDS